MVKLAMISEDDVKAVHKATLQILDEVGIALTYPEARELLCDYGARISGDRVMMPSDLVESAVSKCPHYVELRGRSGKEIVLGDGRLYWHNLGGAFKVYEPDKKDCRPAVVQDVCNSTRLLDALNGLTSITPLFTPADVPGEVITLAMYRHTLPNTTKPVHGPGVKNDAEVRYIARMAEVVGNPRKILTLGISSVSPLDFSDDIVKAIIESAKLGVAIGPLPCPTVGATSPMSLAGSLAQQNAEVLAMIVLAQLAEPGLPIFYCGRLAPMDLFTGSSRWDAPEIGIMSAATVQIAHSYNLPVNVYGCTSTQRIDMSDGHKRALNAVVPALAGADELSGIGELEGGLASSYAQMVYDNDIAVNVQRIRQGFSVNEESLAVNVMADVIKGQNNFLTEQHTLKYMRAGEVFTYRDLIEQNQKGFASWAHNKAEHILKEHKVTPLDEHQEHELDTIMNAAEKELVK